MPLKDIGGGVGIVDLAPYTNQVLQLRQIQGQEEARRLAAEENALDIKKKQAELEGLPAKQAKDQADAQTANVKVMQDAVQLALGGDYRGATSAIRGIGRTEEVRPHRKKGWVTLFDPATSTEKEFDVMGATKARDHAALEAELIKRAAIGRQATPEDVSTLGVDLLKTGVAQTPAQATKAAKAIFAASGRKLTSPDGKTSVRIGDLPQQTIANLNESAIMVNAAARVPQAGARATGEIDENTRMVPRSKLTREELEPLNGIFNSNRVLTEQVLPKFVEYSKDARVGTNALNTKVQDIGRVFGLNSPEYLALKTLTGDFLFKKIKEESGAAFTEKEYEVRKALMPNESDTLGQAIAKTSALVALNATTAGSRLSVLEAADRDVGGVRNLFRGLDIPEMTAREAQTIMNSIPPEIRQNREVMEEFAEVLPPGMRNEFDAILKNAGTPRRGGVARSLKEALGIGK